MAECRPLGHIRAIARVGVGPEACPRHRIRAAPADAGRSSWCAACRQRLALPATLAYTRQQAAGALAISLATIDRRVVPAIATVSTAWGERLLHPRFG